MKKILLVLAALGLVAAEPAGSVHWRDTELRGYGAKLASRMEAGKLANEQLGNFGNHSVMMVHREGNGEAEVHLAQADIFVVREGEATLVCGGEVVGGKTTAPGEIRGPSIRGGERTRIGPGDIVHIPAKLPHQVLVAPGAKITYAIVKIDVK